MNLTPNEIVGYRIKPDYFSFNVVVVKRHGVTSSKHGEEYEKPLAYCSSISNAVAWLINHVTRVKGAELQEQEFLFSGSIADAKKLEEAIHAGVQEANKAVLELTKQIEALALKQKDIVRMLNKSLDKDTLIDSGE